MAQQVREHDLDVDLDLDTCDPWPWYHVVPKHHPTVAPSQNKYQALNTKICREETQEKRKYMWLCKMFTFWAKDWN